MFSSKFEGIDIRGYYLGLDKVKQDRHRQGSLSYIEGRSILFADPIMLIRLYSGRGTPIIINGVWNNKERFEHTSNIGIWKSYDGKISVQTNRGIFHYSRENGVHIVPARPENYISKEN